TDVDDKIIARSRQENIPPQEVAERYIEEYFEDMEALHILRAHVYPRATQEIPRMVEMIRALVDRGFAYAADGDVYFRVTHARGYGTLSRRTLEGMEAGARVERGVRKEHPMDFTLWKAAKPEEPSWESPWGMGRPGWHIECSAMSLHYLGTTLDIHGGGQDLIFPHHENEIAQTESYTGVSPCVRFWVHNGLLRLGEDKMSKSLGNLVTIKAALARFSPDALRLFFLSSHYRSPLNYTEAAVVAQERAAERLRTAAREETSPAPEDTPQVDPEPLRQRFLAAMDDDLNTPLALAALFDLAREINRGPEAGNSVARARQVLRELAGILGLTLQEVTTGAMAAHPFIELLVALRSSLRSSRQFTLADMIRTKLQELGVTLEDTPQETRWRYDNR
ncbi:MAG: cysteine--tRNA ligase, partial [Chloroflexi bacterium]|nr:cysteine--tRNA ligase [Chloroflexota bacterium]